MKGAIILLNEIPYNTLAECYRLQRQWPAPNDLELDMSRLEQLRQMLTDEPEDTFLNYALALELDKHQQHDESLTLFEKLVQLDPPYVPAFFMAGQMLNRLDRNDEAKNYLSRGIDEARRQGNDHAAGEMSEFLSMISDQEL